MEATKLEVKLTYVLIFVIVKLIGRINQRTWILYDWLHSGIFVGIYLKKKKKKEAGSLSLSNLSLVHQLCCSPGHIMFLSIFVERHQVILPSPPLNLEIENWEVVNCILTWYIYQWTHLLMLVRIQLKACFPIDPSLLPPAFRHGFWKWTFHRPFIKERLKRVEPSRLHCMLFQYLLTRKSDWSSHHLDFFGCFSLSV